MVIIMHMTTAARLPRLDLLAWPVIGPFLRWRHARTAMQIPIFLLAALMIFDGLAGPQLAPKNLVTVGAWLHYRGLVVLALLVAGNLFCMACPFMLPRQAGWWLRERLGGAGRPIPRLLRNKWLAIGLIVAFFFCYEYFSLWATPWWSAWVAVAYFAAAFLVDTVFRGAAFCKHICPLGQFNFFGSLISPLEIKVRQPSTCDACRTKDCIRPARALIVVGSPSAQTLPQNAAPQTQVEPPGQHDASRRGGEHRTPAHGSVPSASPPLSSGQRGCELWLFQPRKAGNMDCTFCLDCVHACPHDNVGLIARTPTAELWTDPYRAGIGRFSRRADLAALVVVFTFGAFLNAFNMIKPVYALQTQLTRALAVASPAPGLALIFVFGLVILPSCLLGAAALASRAGNRTGERSITANIMRYVYTLVPMGFGMWLAHYTFHFLTGGLTIVPVVQSFLADVGWFGGKAQWDLGALVPPEWLFPVEAILLYLGAFGSIIAVFQVARGRTASDEPAARRAVIGAALPWILLVLALLGFGLWIMLQPMEMRGTMQMVGGTRG
jgi:polyferredoxin